MFFRTLFIQAQSANLKFKQAYPVTTKLHLATQVSILCYRGLLGVSPLIPQPLRIERGVVMAKKNLKTTYKKLRLTELEAEQIDKYLLEHKLTFTDLVNGFIGRAILSEFPTVPPEPPKKEDSDTDHFPRKAKNKSVRPPPKADPALLFQLGKIGNNINQIAKSLNRIAQQQPTPEFSFLECLHTLSLIQSDVHEVTGELPKIKRSEEAVKKARERAIAKVLNRGKEGEVLDVL